MSREGARAARESPPIKGQSIYGADDFKRDTGVSRETLSRFERYAALLARWQRAMNLVSAKTVHDVWRRHFLDSAQLAPLIPPYDGALYDVGSGAGFPGMVLAMLGLPRVALIESDSRKYAFLREVARETDTTVHIWRRRVGQDACDSAPLPPADVIVARALAPLFEALDMVFSILHEDTYCIFLKGAQVETELEAAQTRWAMQVERFPSRSDPSGTILRMRGLTRVS